MADDRSRLLGEARSAIKAGRSAEAVELLERWLARRKDDATAWALMAAAHSEAGDWGTAEVAARRVVHLMPNSPRAWANWGVTLRKLGKIDEAEKAQRKALSLDPRNETARRELRKLQRLPPSVDAQETCPVCGERVFPTDTQCLGCGADLVVARAEQRRAAQARARAEAAAREAARRQAAQQQIEAWRAVGFDDQEIFGKLVAEGWDEMDVRKLLGIGEGVWVVTLPEGRYAFVASVDEAKQLREDALHRVSELREEIRSINQQIGEIQSAAYAAQVVAGTRPDEGPDDDAAGAKSAPDPVAMLMGMRKDAETLIREWELTIDALDAWIAQNY